MRGLFAAGLRFAGVYLIAVGQLAVLQGLVTWLLYGGALEGRYLLGIVGHTVVPTLVGTGLILLAEPLARAFCPEAGGPVLSSVHARQIGFTIAGLWLVTSGLAFVLSGLVPVLADGAAGGGLLERVGIQSGFGLVEVLVGVVFLAAGR